MAYPEPLLPLNAKKGKEFLKRFDAFSISDEQKERLRGLRDKIRSERRDD